MWVFVLFFVFLGGGVGVVINSGKRTEWSPIRSVIIKAYSQIILHKHNTDLHSESSNSLLKLISRIKSIFLNIFFSKS